MMVSNVPIPKKNFEMLDWLRALGHLQLSSTTLI